MSLLLFYRAYSFMCSHIVMNGSMAFARPTRTDMCVHITRAKGKAESTAAYRSTGAATNILFCEIMWI